MPENVTLLDCCARASASRVCGTRRVYDDRAAGNPNISRSPVTPRKVW